MLSDWILLAIRIILGSVMIYYGWPKVKDLRANADDFVKMGFKPGWFWGTVIAIVEFIGGSMILLGFFAPVAAVFIAIHMSTGTVWKITKADKPFTDWSYDLLILASALAIFLNGAGAYRLASL